MCASRAPGALARVARALAAALTLTLAASTARAQACCTATGSSGFGVVGRCYFAALASELSYDRGFGTFDAQGRFEQLSRAEADDIVLALAGGVRLGTPMLQLYGSVPVRLQYRDLHGLPAASAVGFGDSSVTLRAMTVEDRMTGIELARPATLIPFVEPFIGLRAPTGRPATRSTEPTGVDAMGEGGWVASAGVALTKYVTLSTAATITASYGKRFPYQVEQGKSAAKFQPGDELDARLGVVHVFDLLWSASAFVSGRFTAESGLDGVSIGESRTRRIRLGAGVERYLVFPTWQLGLSASLDPPLAGFGQNLPFAGTTLSLSMQRNFTW